VSLSGNLQDVTVADVFQFVHLGRSSGTLRLENAGKVAEIGFHDGEIINAGCTGQPRIGELLLARGAITQEDLDQAILSKQRLRHSLPLGEHLVAEGVLDPEELRRAVVKQIKDTIVRIFRWRGGTFEFRRGTPRGCENPGSAEARARLLEVKINTERLLLEAAQLLDEGSEAELNVPEAVPAAQPVQWEAESGEWDVVADGILRRAGHSILSQHGIDLMSSDAELARGLASCCSEDPTGASVISNLGLAWKIIDLREGQFELETVNEVLNRDAAAPVLTLIDDQTMAAKAYDVGAKAALPPDPELVWSALTSLCRGYRADHPDTASLYSALGRLRQVMRDIRQGVMSTTVALTLMDFIGENVERAVIFLVRQSDLKAIGAFGFGVDHRPLAELTSRLEFPKDGDDVLAQAARDGQLRDLTWGDADLPEALKRALGPPKYDQLVVLPVEGTDRVLALIYADNGDLKAPLRDLELLELAGSQVGTALENELLRRQLSATSPSR
jgi:GAF domain-containing protein